MLRVENHVVFSWPCRQVENARVRVRESDIPTITTQCINQSTLWGSHHVDDPSASLCVFQRPIGTTLSRLRDILAASMRRTKIPEFDDTGAHDANINHEIHKYERPSSLPVCRATRNDTRG